MPDDDGDGELYARIATVRLLGEVLVELRELNANISRLEADLRPLLPFRFGRGRGGG